MHPLSDDLTITRGHGHAAEESNATLNNSSSEENAANEIGEGISFPH